MDTAAAPAEADTPDARYAALAARDARFDGRFFVGVTSTGIYCRPVCRVRLPLQRNCRFFGNAASAEQAGFRPCLRCRPELAPGLSFTDSSQVLAQHAARLMEQAVMEGQPVSLPGVAGRLGVTDRHLRRIFQEAHGVSPIDFLTTQRLLLAKRLLTDTAMPVTHVALASGYGSVRRFNAAFAERYRLSPSALRREPAGPEAGAPVRSPRGAMPAGRGRARPSPAQPVLRLGYRPPFDVPGVLRFFAQRAVPGIEAVDGLSLRRTLVMPHGAEALAGWLELRFVPERHEVHVTLSPAFVPVLGAALQRVRHALDLDADPALVDPVLATLPMVPVPGIRLAGSFDGFETAMRVVLGQQVTVAAARTLARRIAERFGEAIETPFADLVRLPPTPAAIAQADPEEIGRLGIVRQRVRALQALAAEVHAGRIALHRGAPLAATMAAMQALPGIGEWTAQLIALRALAWPDAFPSTDIGLLNALGTRDVAAVLAQAEAWRPWRGYAVMRLWQHLETLK
ncbi:Ada metal-binding domain-containing protein [Aquincola sp. MAHUQ-54]|uniref:DNA-3-methyladenine glycosylase II n=1 Tax=Aquincola agrisoli TaxID=3119538 RepID=A0AAW9QGB7_9BURK